LFLLKEGKVIRVKYSSCRPKVYYTRIIIRIVRIYILCIACIGFFNLIFSGECDNWQTNHPEWIWCDDGEGSHDLSANYEDIDDNNNIQYVDDDTWEIDVDDLYDEEVDYEE